MVKLRFRFFFAEVSACRTVLSVHTKYTQVDLHVKITQCLCVMRLTAIVFSTSTHCPPPRPINLICGGVFFLLFVIFVPYVLGMAVSCNAETGLSDPPDARAWIKMLLA